MNSNDVAAMVAKMDLSEIALPTVAELRKATWTHEAYRLGKCITIRLECGDYITSGLVELYNQAVEMRDSL